jgi:tRNA(fMet)-specific endonuclease VapC
MSQYLLDTFELAFSAQTLPTVTGFSIYAKEKARLRRSGWIVGEFDLLIGSTALRYDLILVTETRKILRTWLAFSLKIG